MTGQLRETTESGCLASLFFWPLGIGSVPSDCRCRSVSMSARKILSLLKDCGKPCHISVMFERKVWDPKDIHKILLRVEKLAPLCKQFRVVMFRLPAIAIRVVRLADTYIIYPISFYSDDRSSSRSVADQSAEPKTETRPSSSNLLSRSWP